MAIFESLVSPEQERLSNLVTKNGGVEVVMNDDSMLLHLDESASEASSTPSAEDNRVPRAKVRDAKPNVVDLKNDILEEPAAAVQKNQTSFFGKFEAQKNEIVHELKLVVRRETDRVIEQMRNGPHDLLRDRVSSLAPHSFSKHMSIIFLSPLDDLQYLERNGGYHVAFRLLKA